MPVKFRSAAGQWAPDSDEVNAPESVYLRADNTVSDERGSRSLRLGSKTIYSGLPSRVHSLYAATLQGSPFRLIGAGDEIWIDGTRYTKNVSGVGDLAIGDDSYQAFFARGRTKLKFDGKTLRQWGLDRPAKEAVGTANNAVEYSIATFSKTEAVNDPAVIPAVQVKEGTGGDTLVQITGEDEAWEYDGWPEGYDTTVDGALAMRPDIDTGRASCQKIWDTDQDMFDFVGNYGGDSDLFDIRVWFQEPRKVDKVTIMFGLSDNSTDPFKDDYYYFDFMIRNTGTVDIKDVKSAQTSALGVAAKTYNSLLSPADKTNVKTPAEASRILKTVGSAGGSKSRERADTLTASPSWGHLTVTRGQFNRVGNTNGRSWKTVRGFKVVYTATPKSTEKIFLDDAIWSGGGSRALTGTFKIGYRFAKVFKDNNGSEIYTELSPMSPISKDVVLQQQLMTVTIPASVINNARTSGQANQIWIYLFGGWLDTYYRFAKTSIGSIGMTIDDISNPNLLNAPTELQRLISHGFTTNPDWQNIGVQALSVRILKSELEALTENEYYEPGASGPPNDIVSIAGPWNRRMFCLTKEGWLYPSTQKSPSSYSLYQTIDLRMYGEPFWVAKTVSGIFVGCAKDIIRIAGSGDNLDDGITCDLYAQPLNIANPPVDRSFYTDGNMIGYRSADGPMMFSGSSAQPLPTDGISLLWKGYNRYGLDKIDTTNGRFRYSVDNHMVYMLVPEGNNPVARIKYGQNPGPDSYITIDKISYRFVPNLTSQQYGANRDVLIGATANDTMTNLVDCINNTNATGNGVRYIIDVAHPRVTAQLISTITSINDIGEVLLTGSSDSKMSIRVTTNTYLRYDDFETSPTAVYRFGNGEWCRFEYPQTPLCIYREPNGHLLIGSDNGEVVQIEAEYGIGDDGLPIDVLLLTSLDDFGNPTTRKTAADLQFHGHTASSTMTLDFLLDESTEADVTVNPATGSSLIYRASLLDLNDFYRLQLKLSGAVHDMSLHAVGVSFTESPKTVMALDLGNVIPENGGDLAWINQVEVDCQTPADLYLDVYKNGVLHTTQTIVTNGDIRDVYTITLPRDTKGRRLGLILRTSQSSGEGRVGFEVHSVKVRHASTGNFTELPVGQTDDRSD